MKHHHPNPGQNRASEQVMVLAPTRGEGVGRALRSAYRGGMDRLPPELQALLARLD